MDIPCNLRQCLPQQVYHATTQRLNYYHITAISKKERGKTEHKTNFNLFPDNLEYLFSAEKWSEDLSHFLPLAK